MDGVHDLGGKDGHGPVVRDEAVFHEDWERRVAGMTMGTFLLGLNNGGQFRHSIERMDPVQYLSTRYHEHWFTGIATRFVEAAMVTLDELEERAGGRVPLSHPVAAGPATAPAPPPAPPAVGDRVRVRSPHHPRGHTRCPQFVRGKVGTVVRLDAPASLPDLEAHGEERRQEPQACVRFDAHDLWGDGSTHGVHVDLWVSYLEPEAP